MKHKSLKSGILLTVALLMIVAVGVTTASLQTMSGTLTNTFDAGGISTGIVEEHDEANGAVKKSRIQNIGESDCLVRARVTISPASAVNAISLTAKGNIWNWNHWSNGDGYVYYEAVLPAGENSYTTYLFEGVALEEGVNWTELGATGFDVTIYEESVQVQVYDSESGQMISALDENGNYNASLASKVWAVYEKNLNQN